MTPQRVAVIGTSGSGKTALAIRVAAVLGVPHLELDAVYHQPGWVPLAEDLFRERVGRFTAQERWVVDGNYSVVRDLVWGRADTVVWLDLSRRVVMRRVVARTMRRMLLRVELWNGNRERPANLVRRTPEENIVLWAWTTHPTNRERYQAAMADPAWAHLRFVRLGSPAEVEAWAASLGGA
jgi:adenylate kinase family enzyme